jgi:cytochrome c peroxidase
MRYAGTFALLLSCVALPACAQESIAPVDRAGTGGGSSSGAASGGSGGGDAIDYDWGLPPGYPKPAVPQDNPMSVEKVELGRRLFYDTRMSLNETQSCATCHEQDKAFTDGLANAVGSTMEIHPRSSMSIVGSGYLTVITWANPAMLELEKQGLVPMFGENPVELGLSGQEDLLLERLGAEAYYPPAFDAAFPEAQGEISLDTITKAIASFERAVISHRSPYDRYAYDGDPTGMSESALRGKDLFFSEKVECFHCHGGFNFSDSVSHEGTVIEEMMFHNTGLYNVDGTGAYPEGNQGVYEITGVDSDRGRFRAPTLRNIALTAPYMHDGSIATLDEVLDHYAAGGRTIASGPNAGVGSDNPYKSEFVSGFSLSAQERADLIAFLESLTDDELVRDPRWSDPWGGTP